MEWMAANTLVIVLMNVSTFCIVAPRVNSMVMTLLETPACSILHLLLRSERESDTPPLGRSLRRGDITDEDMLLAVIISLKVPGVLLDVENRCSFPRVPF
jgi:hypothetical protein